MEGFLTVVSSIITSFLCGFWAIFNESLFCMGTIFFVLIAFLALLLVAVVFEYMIEKRGEYILGQIHTCDVSGNDGNYWLEIQYSFVTPYGDEITKKTKHSVKHLEGTVLTPGTPLAIWYANDKTYEVL